MEKKEARDQFEAGITANDVIRRGESGSYVVGQSQTTETFYERVCSDGSRETFWVSDAVSEGDMLQRAWTEVQRLVPMPALSISPDPSAGGTVNLGMWLALEEPGVVSITAEEGPVWATVTAQFESTSWDMGNGDVVDCDGPGVPISDLDNPDEGPCGYTYRGLDAPNPGWGNSVTGHWTVTFETSSGNGGGLDPIDRTTSYTYRVRELQTVGVANG